MKKLLTSLTAVALAFSMSGCAYLGGKTDLGQVMQETGMENITTGDGTFENYEAVGEYSGTEIGVAIGIPGLIKLIEIYPMQSNEGLLASVANSAANDGANAMINTTPHQTLYTGIPFGLVGIYVDTSKGTGINVR